MRKTIVFLIIFALLIPFFPGQRAHAVSDEEMILRIGLYYGSSALDEAKLQNVTDYGSGYLVGIMNDEDEFVEYGYIPNVYLTIEHGDLYHVLEPQPYRDYDSAAAAAASYTSGFVRCVEGDFYVLAGQYSTAAEADSAAQQYGMSSCGSHSNTLSVKDTQTGRILFQFRSSNKKLAIKPVFDNGTWTSNDGRKRAITWFKTNQYRGIFEYSLYGSSVCVTSVVSMSDYIKGVVPYEMSSSWPIEALKAQAICARTYAVANLTKHASSGFNLCASTCCQAYRGEGSANGLTEQAVDETAGMYATYDGKPINAVYCSSNGGATEDCENVWSEPIPYLRAIVDEYEQYVNTGRSSWSYTITLQQITNVLRARGNSITGSIVNAWAEYTNAGNVRRLHFIDAAGKDITYSGESCRTLFNTSTSGITIYSQRYIFEDAANPRITSNSEITTIAGAAPVPTGTGAAASSSVLTSSGIRASSELYGSNVPILSASGISDAVSFYTVSGDGVFSQSGKTAISAADLEPPTSCSGTFIINGSGWGHNLGMSQYGAKAMAERGLSAEDIIKYYYTGVEISYIR